MESENQKPKLRRAWRVWVNPFGSVQIDPVDVLKIEHVTQTAVVALAAGWRPREVPFAELASTPAKALKLALPLISGCQPQLSTGTDEKTAIPTAGAVPVGSLDRL